MTARIGIRALQQHASDAVRRVSAGESLEITDRGRAVARIVPIRDSRIEDLIAAGLLRPARAALATLPLPLPSQRDAVTLTELLAHQRADER